MTGSAFSSDDIGDGPVESEAQHIVRAITDCFRDGNAHFIEVHWDGHEEPTFEPIHEFVSTDDINTAFIDYLRSKTNVPHIRATTGQKIHQFQVQNNRLQFKLGRSRSWVDGVKLINERPDEVATFFIGWIKEADDEDDDPPVQVDPLPPAQRKFTRIFQGLDLLPTTEAELVKHILPILANLHLTSRALLRLPVVEKLTISQQLAIREVLLDWGAEVKPKMDFVESNSSTSQREFASLYLEWCSLPVERILPVTSLHKDVQQTEVFVDGYPDFNLVVGTAPPLPQPQRPSTAAAAAAAGDMSTSQLEHKKIDATIKATKAGRNSGPKILHSHGIAPPTEATKRVISSSFPEYTEEFDPSLTVTDPNSCYNLSHKIYLKDLRASSSGNKSVDVYGMSPDFLKLVKDTKDDPRPNPLVQLARIMAHLQKAHLISDVTAFVASAGSIIPLNKISAQVNELRDARGEDPKVRPINQGHGLFATTCKTLNSTNDAKKVRNGMKNIQYADKKHGIQKLVAAARGAYNSGFALSKTDMINGFNALSGKKMSDTIAEKWNRLHSFHFRFLSGKFGKPTFLPGYRDGLPVLYVIFQREGAKQGNSLGSTTFNLTMAHNVYDPLQLLFPEVPLAAATDDLIRFFRTPDAEAPPDVWGHFFVSVSEHMAKFDELIGNIKLARHPDKDVLLLPPHAMIPSEAIEDPVNHGHYTLRCPNGITLHISMVGTDVCKSPIGTDDFIRSYTNAKVMELNKRTDLVGKLGEVNPQIGFKMLRQSTNGAFDHYSSVTPALDTTATDSFDTTILAAASRMLDIKPIGPYRIDPFRWKRATQILRLSLKNGGFDLTSATVKAPLLYYSSLINASSDTLVKKFIGGISAEATTAHQRLIPIIGGMPTAGSELSVLISPDPLHPFLEESVSGAPASFESKKLFQVLMDQVRRLARTQLREDVISETESNLTRDAKSSRVHVLALTSASGWSRVISTDVSVPANRVQPSDLKAYLRFILNLPQKIAGEAIMCDAFDYPVESCRHQHRRAVDLGDNELDCSGNHAVWCPAAYNWRSWTHSICISTIGSYATRAGYHVQREPPTHRIIDDVNASRLFAKKPTACSKAAAKHLEKALDDISHLNTNSARITHLQNAITEAQNLIPADEGGVAARTDLILRDVNSSSTTLIIDVTVRHSTAKRSLSASHTKLMNEQITERMLSAAGLHPIARSQNLPAIAAAVKEKHERYGVIEKIVNMRHKAGIAPAPARFVAAAISHRGEMAGELIDMIERLTMRAKTASLRSSSLLGLSPSQTTAVFRSGLKDRLMVNIASGWGRQLLAAGTPCAWGTG